MKKVIFLNVLLLLMVANIICGQSTIASPYCDASYSDTPSVVQTYIKSVTLGNLSNISNTQFAFPHYVMYNNIVSDTIAPGFTYTIDISFNVVNTAKYAVFIDYNKDGGFNLDELIAFGTLSASTNAIVSQAFIVPFSAINKPTRLRIRIVEDNQFTGQACGTFSNGETEDYDIAIGQKPTSIDQLYSNGLQIKVYPNPTSNKFQIRNSKPQRVKELYNSVGQMILSTQENEIDVSHLSKGIYYLRCENQSVKVVVE